MKPVIAKAVPTNNQDVASTVAVVAANIETQSINTNQEANMTIDTINTNESTISMEGISINKTRFETERGVVVFNRNDASNPERVTSILFDLGYDDRPVVRGKSFGSGKGSTMAIAIVRTWINMILLNDFEQGLLEDNVLINNGHVPGSTERAGFRINDDGTVDEVFCWLMGRYDFQSLRNKRGDYRGQDGYYAELRAKAAYLFFTASENRLISIGENYSSWVQAVLMTLQMPEENWGEIRSMKTSNKVARQRLYREIVKPAVLEHQEAEEKGEKAVRKLESTRARTLSEYVFETNNGSKLTIDQLLTDSGKFLFHSRNWVYREMISLDDPQLMEKVDSCKYRGLYLNDLYILPDRSK